MELVGLIHYRHRVFNKIGYCRNAKTKIFDKIVSFVFRFLMALRIESNLLYSLMGFRVFKLIPLNSGKLNMIR